MALSVETHGFITYTVEVLKDGEYIWRGITIMRVAWRSVAVIEVFDDGSIWVFKDRRVFRVKDYVLAYEIAGAIDERRPYKSWTKAKELLGRYGVEL